MNDEWISANQLYQLYSGDQLLENEGKYGKLFTGEVTNYFNTRGNSLAYSLFLPVISLIPMWIFVHAGNLSRYIVLVFWLLCAGIGILSLDFIKKNWIKSQQVIVYLLLGALFFFFVMNILVYTPFEMGIADRPVEIASIVFANEILLSLMAVIFYKLYRLIFGNIYYCLAGVIISLSCSSFLFWAGTAKDHVLIAFLFLCVLFFCIGYLKTRNQVYGFFWFVSLGLLIWGRPELGSVICICSIIFFLLFIIKKHISGEQEGIIKTILPFTGIFPGISPFLFNNWLITGNPCIPPQYLYVLPRYLSKYSQTNVSTVSFNTINEGDSSFIITFIHHIFRFYTPDIQNVFLDVLTLLFITTKGSFGILLICPIIIPAFFQLICDICERDFTYVKKHSSILIFCGVMTCGIILAYLRGFHGMGISSGSTPDVRYLSPLYITLSIISVIIMGKKWEYYGEKICKSLICIVCILPVWLLFMLLSMQSYGYVNDLDSIALLILVFTILSSGTVILHNIKRKCELFSIIFFEVLVALPLTWQLLVTFVYAYFKLNGYLFWLPIVEKFYSSFFSVIQ